MNQPQIIQDCIPCLFWNLVVPALAWALVIAGLTWTIRARMGGSKPHQLLNQDPTEHGCVLGDKLDVDQLTVNSTCCGIFARSQPSTRGEETCTQKK